MMVTGQYIQDHCPPGQLHLYDGCDANTPVATTYATLCKSSYPWIMTVKNLAPQVKSSLLLLYLNASAFDRVCFIIPFGSQKEALSSDFIFLLPLPIPSSQQIFHTPAGTFAIRIIHHARTQRLLKPCATLSSCAARFVRGLSGYPSKMAFARSTRCRSSYAAISAITPSSICRRYRAWMGFESGRLESKCQVDTGDCGRLLLDLWSLRSRSDALGPGDTRVPYSIADS